MCDTRSEKTTRRRGTAVVSHVALAIALSLAACARPAPRVVSPALATSALRARAAEDKQSAAPHHGPADAASCEARIAERALPPPGPRWVAYTRRLPEVVVRAQIDPVLYLRWPDEQPRSAQAAAFLSAIEHASVPGRALGQFLATHTSRALRREVVLADGTLFSSRPPLAVALSTRVSLDDLFEGPRVYRARDGVVDTLERGEGGYLEPDGTLATLRLNDRVSEDPAALADPLGIDLEVVRQQSGALRTIPTAIGADAAALELWFPDGTRRPSLVVVEGGHTQVVCVGGAPDTLAATQDDAQRFWTRHRAVVAAAQALVDESPRFDEPTDELPGVQQDGELRPAWEQAYEGGETTFTFGSVEYPVFDAQGRPIPPEVCIDLFFDAWQRAGGTWYRPQGEPPGRTQGAWDLERAHLPRRSVPRLLAEADDEGSVLDRYDVPEEDRISLAHMPEYAYAVAREADAFREGDGLIVFGLRLQDFHRHYHTLLVIRTEPTTGIPMLIADNQGRPRLRTLANAMFAAPYRSIMHRLRFDLDALSALAP